MSEATQSPEAYSNNKDIVVKIVTHEGIYNIIYGNHLTPTNPDLLPQGLSGIVLETGGVDWYEDPQGALNFVRNHPQYRNLVPRLETDRIPIYLVDSGYNIDNDIEWVSTIADSAVSTSEGVLGSALAFSAARDLRQKEISRRKLLKSGIKGLAGLYLLSPFVVQAGRLLAEISGEGRGLSADAFAAVEKIHPEANLFGLKIRDALIAYKEQKILEQLQGRQNIATVIGAAHVGIEDRLRATPPENLAYLDALQPIISAFANKNTFSNAVEFEFDGRSWQQTAKMDFPELQSLLK